jgi:hypothetical protein
MSDTSESDVRGDLIPDHIVGANQPEAIRDDPSAGIAVAISQAS